MSHDLIETLQVTKPALEVEDFSQADFAKLELLHERLSEIGGKLREEMHLSSPTVSEALYAIEEHYVAHFKLATKKTVDEVHKARDESYAFVAKLRKEKAKNKELERELGIEKKKNLRLREQLSCLNNEVGYSSCASTVENLVDDDES
jgi:hypothetical protein